MKLLDQSSKYHIQYSLILLAIIGLALYIIFVILANREIDEDLLEAKSNLEKQIEKLPDTNFELLLNHEKIFIEETKYISDVQQFRDTSYLDLVDGDLEHFRTLVFHQMIHDRPCRITISKSKIEKKDLLFGGGIVFLVASAFLFFGLNYLNRRRSKKRWEPFHQILDQLEKFSVNDPQPIHTIDTNIDEFDMLGLALHDMTDKMRKDIEAIKSFSENASHEIQTPLAMIRNKIDLLIQSDHLKEGELDTLREVSLSAHRLSKLTESLLALTRIENYKFTQEKWLSVDEQLQHKLQDFEPIIEARAIKMSKEIHACRLKISQEALDMILNNVLSNAVKHNVERGLFHIKLDQEGLFIENSGPKPNQPPYLLMDRFQKGVDDPHSFGLGFSIIGGICKAYGFDFSYQYENELHTTQILFSSDDS